jgi:heme/copper-type cytochrome/quinol oxidase subunit 4
LSSIVLAHPLRSIHVHPHVVLLDADNKWICLKGICMFLISIVISDINQFMHLLIEDKKNQYLAKSCIIFTVVVLILALQTSLTFMTSQSNMHYVSKLKQNEVNKSQWKGLFLNKRLLIMIQCDIMSRTSVDTKWQGY